MTYRNRCLKRRWLRLRRRYLFNMATKEAWTPYFKACLEERTVLWDMLKKKETEDAEPKSSDKNFFYGGLNAH